MISFPERYVVKESNRAEIQRLLNDIVNNLSSDDVINISVERTSDREELIKDLIHEGIII